VGLQGFPRLCYAPGVTLPIVKRPLHAALLAAVLLLAGCGGRFGYRGSYRDPSQSGTYGGAWLTFAASTAARAEPVGSSPYWLLNLDYQLAHGPDFATLGTGVAVAPDALGWHNAVTFQVGWEMWRGAGLHVSVCDGYGNWGVVTACARWSSKGYWGVDLGAGLSPTRLAADVHENCRDGGCSSSGGGWDD
jgi:hypothetical protein